jgi:MFS family permease
MQAQGFGPGAIGSTVLVGGLLTVPLLPLIGMLADRLGRRPVTMLAYGLSALGMLTLAGAVDLWQLWIATALLSIGSSACGALTAALAADLLPGSLLARGFGRLGVANWVAASLGSVGVGFGFAVMGATGLYLAAAGLAIVAAGLLGVAGGWHTPALALRNYERR